MKKSGVTGFTGGFCGIPAQYHNTWKSDSGTNSKAQLPHHGESDQGSGQQVGYAGLPQSSSSEQTQGLVPDQGLHPKGPHWEHHTVGREVV